MAVALIVAAGRGERLGAGQPKALVPVCGRPMLERSVAALQAVTRISTIVVALPPGHLDAAPAGTIAVAGGATRSESVLAALNAAFAVSDTTIPSAAADRDEAVIVHDAARIFASPELFEAALDELARSAADAVVAAAPVTDTIKQVEPGGRTVAATLDRSQLWAIQTPQVFDRAALEAALRSDPALLAQATDDAWLVEQSGGRVVVLPAPAENFKITTQLDLRLAELILSARHGNP